VYCSQSPWPNVRAQFVAAGVGEPLWWIAAPSSSLQLLPGTVATQCLYAGDYDVSALADYVPGLFQEGSMSHVLRRSSDGAEFLMPAGLYLSSEAMAAPYVAALPVISPDSDADCAAELAVSLTALAGAIAKIPATSGGGSATPLTVILTGTATPETAAAAPPVA
jgi:hypothetical protein